MYKTTLEFAQEWIDRGYSVIPITYRSKRPAFDALKLTGSLVDGELSWSEYKNRLPTSAELKLWFSGPKRNLGVVTGYRNLVVIDFDSTDIYDAWYYWAQAEGGKAAAVKVGTFKVFTARGVHVYLTITEDVESFKLPGIDIKSKWGYVLAPPSVHPSGYEYATYGGSIMNVSRLSEVFPFEKLPPEVYEPEIQAVTDPWESAEKAVTCGGGEVIAQIHARVTAADLLGVNLGNHKSVLTKCFLHDDANPSLLVYADGTCRCMAGCNGGKALDSIDVYAALHHLTNREAIAALSH